MNKRRLTRQQQKRIAAQQQLTLQKQAGTTRPDTCNGRVVSHFGKQLRVEAIGHERPGKLIQCHQRANLPELVTGDLVLWQEASDDRGVILARGERRSVFSRPDNRGREKSLAANLDCVVIVIAAVPEPFMNLVDRYLVAVENLGLPPLLVLNKTDLLADGKHENLDSMLSIYRTLGYPVFRVSALTSAGIADLEAALSGLTTVLVGQSGVGKSSLINALGGGDLAAVGELSEAKGKGTHTTTTTRLFHLPYCDLIDSPGIREFHLAHLDSRRLLDGFPELRTLAGQCRFRDCQHRDEPDCAIGKALADGRIHPRRWQSYCHLRDTLATPEF